MENITARITEQIDGTRSHITSTLSREHRSSRGQFFTPANVAKFMASLIDIRKKRIRILDPGAGIGTLTSAAIEHLLGQPSVPDAIHVVAFEIESTFVPALEESMERCRVHSEDNGVQFTYEIRNEDFLEATAKIHQETILDLAPPEQFDCAILNPPYRKINTKSPEREWIRAIGFETSNLYAGFLGAAAALLEDNGQLIAISPRSFCNGPYFRAFRKFLLERNRFTDIHTYESRSEAFKDDAVLQETIIFATRKSNKRRLIRVSTSISPGSGNTSRLRVPPETVVQPNDTNLFIRIVTSQDEANVAQQMSMYHTTLAELNLEVSTGRVVDFRTQENLRMHADGNTAPLIYPMHFEKWGVTWPSENGRKSNAIDINNDTRTLLLPAERYVLTKRFTSKEERRRLVAVVCEQDGGTNNLLGIENHINYFHTNNRGLPRHLAWGLAGFLNSLLVDRFFRLFNGHTQVNATDLRSLSYPSKEGLVEAGKALEKRLFSPEELDELFFLRVVPA